MDISVTNNRTIDQFTNAYRNFESPQIPFAAVKLNVCCQNTSKKEIDEIIEDNFRSEKDLILKKNQNYLILMKNTPIEAAERAVSRLKAKISHITRNWGGLGDWNANHASAYIFGSIGETTKLQIKYLDLTPDANPLKSKNPKIRLGCSEYSRWLDLQDIDDFKINHIINVTV